MAASVLTVSVCPLRRAAAPSSACLSHPRPGWRNPRNPATSALSKIRHPAKSSRSPPGEKSDRIGTAPAWSRTKNVLFSLLRSQRKKLAVGDSNSAVARMRPFGLKARAGQGETGAPAMSHASFDRLRPKTESALTRQPRTLFCHRPKPPRGYRPDLGRWLLLGRPPPRPKACTMPSAPCR